jgi:cytochrome b561
MSSEASAKEDRASRPRASDGCRHELRAAPRVLDHMTIIANTDQDIRPRGETRPHYHPIGITFHWAMAALVFFQLFWGWRVSLLAPGYEKLDGYALHALVGGVLLLLAFMRAGWRIMAPFILPELEKPEDMPGWQHFAAEAVHFALYGVMFALPVSGWIMLSQTAPGGEIALPWALTLSAFPLPDDLSFIERAKMEQAAESAHFWLVWLTMALIVMHVGAALKHHFIDKDDVLARMIPLLAGGKPRP